VKGTKKVQTRSPLGNSTSGPASKKQNPCTCHPGPDPILCPCPTDKLVTVKGNKKVQPTKSNYKEELLLTTLERLNNKIDEISARLEKIEDQYANKNIGTPRTILRKNE
jgi:hypothetical protein